MATQSLEQPLKWHRRVMFYCNENLSIVLTSDQPLIKYFALILIILFNQYLASSMQ